MGAFMELESGCVLLVGLREMACMTTHEELTRCSTDVRATHESNSDSHKQQ